VIASLDLAALGVEEGGVGSEKVIKVIQGWWGIL
jgi:hypothetical protein